MSNTFPGSGFVAVVASSLLNKILLLLIIIIERLAPYFTLVLNR